MCYYNAINIIKESVVSLNGISKPLEGVPGLHTPVLSGFEYGSSPVLKKRTDAEDFDIVRMEWGFLPSYVRSRAEAERFRKGYKDEKGVFHHPITTLNAIGEEILLPRKMFRNAALKRRCLVLSTGFYEWRHHSGINKRTGQPLKSVVKYPYYIHLKNKEYLFMAGVWEPWEDRETGEYAETFSILTTAANEMLSLIHNSKKRMPLILPDELAWEWLMEAPDEKRISEIAHYRFPSRQMEAWSIAKDFRMEADPIKPVHYEELPDIA